jgi:acetyl-CoA synthetase
MSTPTPGQSLTEFLAARQFLLDHREDLSTAYEQFRWPELDEFNWALEWFDLLGADPESADRPALWIVDPDGEHRRWSFAELSRRSNQVANWLRAQGVQRGDRILLMLGNQVELWETILAAMKLGAVVIPATTLLGPADLRDRIDRGGVGYVVAASTETIDERFE